MRAGLTVHSAEKYTASIGMLLGRHQALMMAAERERETGERYEFVLVLRPRSVGRKETGRDGARGGKRSRKRDGGEKRENGKERNLNRDKASMRRFTVPRCKAIQSQLRSFANNKGFSTFTRSQLKVLTCDKTKVFSTVDGDEVMKFQAIDDTGFSASLPGSE